MFTVTVAPRFAAVTYRRGVFDRVLPAGRHLRRPGTRMVLVDLRQRLVPLAAQEIPAADGVTVRLSATLRVAVSDPRAFVERAQDPLAVVYLAAQLALREHLAGLEATTLTARGAVLPLAAVTEQVAGTGRDVGLDVQAVLVKDVLLPAEVRAAALAVVTARQQAAVRLEQARAETAALRSLANAARLLDAHPALARQRLVEAAGSGAKVVLQLSPDPDGDAG